MSDDTDPRTLTPEEKSERLETLTEMVRALRRQIAQCELKIVENMTNPAVSLGLEAIKSNLADQLKARLTERDQLSGIAPPASAPVPTPTTPLPQPIAPTPAAPALPGKPDLLLRAITEGRVIPFLGNGVNLFQRVGNAPWQVGKALPNGNELAAYLAQHFDYPQDGLLELVRVSEYAAVMEGSGRLYEELRTLFNADYPLTALHLFLAELPGMLRAKGFPTPYQTIITTNYDDLLERAFLAADEPFDLVWYIAEGDDRGKFQHRQPNGTTMLIEKPNEYQGLSPSQRTTIVKLHGAVDRNDPERDSYVITEDNYINYLARADISNLVPVTISARIRKSHFLFLGYTLRDWNLRVILHRIWGEQKLNYKSWAVQPGLQPLDREFWNKRNVEAIDMNLESYIAALRERINALPPAGGA